MNDDTKRADLRLEEILSADPVRERAVSATVALVRSEVERKRGVSGVAVRTGYAVVERVKPTMIEDIVRATLPAFCRALESHWQAAAGTSATGEGSDETVSPATRAERAVRLEQRLVSRANEVADALLAVSDGKIGASRPAIARTYRVMRPSAREHVIQAVPGLAAALRGVLVTST